MAKKTTSQSGNVLLLILIGIFLFGALSYTFTRSSRPAGSMTENDARIYANEILAYAAKIEGAVQTVMAQNGCLAEDVSFQNSTVAGYTNAGSADKCKVFDAAGGGMIYTAPPSAAIDTARAAASGYPPAAALANQYFFTAHMCLDGIGTGTHSDGCEADGLNNEDIVIIAPFVKYDVCVAINKILKNDANMLVDADASFEAQKFTGSFGDGAALGNGGYTVYNSGCYNSTSADSPDEGYHFYHVLLAR